MNRHGDDSATIPDRVYRDPRTNIADFAFDATVAQAFSDMIRRSVPGYETAVALSGLIAARHLRPGRRCYDLGCSLGASTLAILKQIGAADCEIVAVDSSPAMLERARTLNADPRVRWVLEDVRETEIRDACAVVMNYTLQFVPAPDRLDLLRRIRAGLEPGGVLVVAEKIASDAYEEDLHRAFKQANGYSDLEIAQKRAALENVMQPDSAERHLERFADAGFADVRIWFRCLNWASFLARV